MRLCEFRVTATALRCASSGDPGAEEKAAVMSAACTNGRKFIDGG